MSVVMWIASRVGQQPIRRIRTLTLAFFCVLLYFFYSRDPSNSYNWARQKQWNPIDKSTMAQLPPSSGPRPRIGRIQYPFTHATSHHDDTHWEEVEMKRWEVKAAFRHAWDGYRKQAWGWDELLPVSGGRRNVFNGWGATMIDALDTMWIMDMKDEFREAVRHVARLDFNNMTSPQLNLFETNIRYLGGLLGAYDLSGEKVLLKKALELGNMLYASFDTPSRMPTLPFFTPHNAKEGTQRNTLTVASAGVGTLSMEFTRLAQLTGEAKFYDAIDRIKRFLLLSQETSRLPGMWPMTLDLSQVKQDSVGYFTIGAEADSLYEYLPKMYLLLNGSDRTYQTMWLRAAMTIEQNLLFKPMIPQPVDILFSGGVVVQGDGRVGISGESFFPNTATPHLRAETGHLDCFSGGMFALGGRVFDVQRHTDIGTKLAMGCSWAYRQFPTGMMPEFLSFMPCETRYDACHYNETLFEKAAKDIPRGILSVRDRRYLLRPEAIESLFVAFRTTGKYTLQDMAWEMFTAVRKHTTTKYGNGQMIDVNSLEVGLEDTMESFWLSETLKYFYLIFSPPDLISLDEWVFNTEAHPFRWRTNPTFDEKEDSGMPPLPGWGAQWG